MASGPRGKIEFYYYEPRGILPLDDRFVVRKSLRQTLNRRPFEIRINTAFAEVIRQCARWAELPRHEVWLSERMIELYEELHRMGYAHSVECWDASGGLVGGLYGLALGSAFFGESMFSRAPFASQIALVALVERLREREFTLCDTQMSSDHLKQFGLLECSQDEYLLLLNEALKLDRTFDQ